ncbi:Cof-like hydrolase [Coriobacterium glomerans PW2]|uniref:Cof-like hydrolase n=1 Tax=Coriobacterium glomerans (strain ATCC 49209 / DSM 20642 / JCM 10262 / PW2) TaxID=700015 RepID=F2N7G3_CORGP|nr:HAD family hydrolase [Coriobacterium glomerans]AEB06779.1 Cof-like hydrolase [Coriobacterium glomerans PW2]
MIRMIASDMDDTFLDGAHRVPAPNIAALERLHELGVLFVPCSGRPYPSIMGNLEDVDQRLLTGTYVISLNGGFINRYGQDEPLTSVTLDRSVAEELYRRGMDEHRIMHVYVPSGTIYTQGVRDAESSYLAGMRGVTALTGTERDLGFVGDEDVVKILYVDTDFDALQRLGERLRPDLDATRVAITYSARRYLEFVPAGMDKGVGVRRLAGMLGIDMDEVMSIGDSANDISMLDAAGIGVGVANVCEDTRAHCDAVTAATGEQGALAEILQRFIEPGYAHGQTKLGLPTT